MKFFLGLCSFLSAVLGIYSFVIFVRIIVSWVVMFTRRNQGWSVDSGSQGPQQAESIIDTLDRILGRICDPYLNLFRGVKGLRRSAVDFTPLLALVVLNLVRSILSIFAQTGEITVWIIIAILVEGLWSSFFSLLIFILIVLLVVRLIAGRSNGYRANNIINTIDSILDGPVGFVYKLFFRGKQVDDQKIVGVSLVFYVVLLVVLSWLENILFNFLISI